MNIAKACRKALEIIHRPKSQSPRIVTVLELRNILDSMVRAGRAEGTVAVLHEGVGYDVARIIWNAESGAVVFISTEQPEPEAPVIAREPFVAPDQPLCAA